MERWEAEGLAQSLCQSFPRSQIAPDIWQSELEPLDKARAEEAVRRVRRQSEHAPSIAYFHGIYGGLLGSVRGDGVACESCSDTGLVTDTDHPRHWPGAPDAMPRPRDPDGSEYCDCNVATWCRDCEHGKRARAMLQRMAGTDQADAA